MWRKRSPILLGTVEIGLQRSQTSLSHLKIYFRPTLSKYSLGTETNAKEAACLSNHYLVWGSVVNVRWWISWSSSPEGWEWRKVSPAPVKLNTSPHSGLPLPVHRTNFWLCLTLREWYIHTLLHTLETNRLDDGVSEAKKHFYNILNMAELCISACFNSHSMQAGLKS